MTAKVLLGELHLLASTHTDAFLLPQESFGNEMPECGNSSGGGNKEGVSKGKPTQLNQTDIDNCKHMRSWKWMRSPADRHKQTLTRLSLTSAFAIAIAEADLQNFDLNNPLHRDLWIWIDLELWIQHSSCFSLTCSRGTKEDNLKWTYRARFAAFHWRLLILTTHGLSTSLGSCCIWEAQLLAASHSRKPQETTCLQKRVCQQEASITWCRWCNLFRPRLHRNYRITWRFGAFKTSTLGIKWCDNLLPNLQFEVAEGFHRVMDAGCPFLSFGCPFRGFAYMRCFSSSILVWSRGIVFLHLLAVNLFTCVLLLLLSWTIAELMKSWDFIQIMLGGRTCFSEAKFRAASCCLDSWARSCVA